MADIWASIKGLFSQINYSKVYVDNNLFRLHYKVTTLVLVIFGILVTSRQYIGDPIDCITDAKLEHIVDQYCWVHSTYTLGKRIEVPDRNGKKSLNVYYEKIDDLEKEFDNLGQKEKRDKVYHTYYQWVWCFLLFQAFTFYLPHYIWKIWEGGKLKTLVSNLNTHLVEDEEKNKNKDTIINYFCEQQKDNSKPITFPCFAGDRGIHTNYVYKYFFCEILNFINVCIQVTLIDKFLNYEFTEYGWKILAQSEERPYLRHDELTRVFPVVTFCSIPAFGVNGELVFHGGLCVLPINILNEKIYIFTWFWFFILLILSAIGVIYRVITLLPFSEIRTFILKRYNRSIETYKLKTICTRFDAGDWFILCLLGRNLNPIYFSELIEELYERLLVRGNGGTGRGGVEGAVDPEGWGMEIETLPKYEKTDL